MINLYDVKKIYLSIMGNYVICRNGYFQVFPGGFVRVTEPSFAAPSSNLYRREESV
jgi:hypothetical protein